MIFSCPFGSVKSFWVVSIIQYCLWNLLVSHLELSLFSRLHKIESGMVCDFFASKEFISSIHVYTIQNYQTWSTALLGILFLQNPTRPLCFLRLIVHSLQIQKWIWIKGFISGQTWTVVFLSDQQLVVLFSSGISVVNFDMSPHIASSLFLVLINWHILIDRSYPSGNWVIAGCTLILLVLSCHDSNNVVRKKQWQHFAKNVAGLWR